MWYPEWKLNQQNRICFVQVDANYQEVAGLGVNWNLFISKNGGAFAPSAGVKSEIGNGWYSYVATAAEANTIGPIAIRVTSASTIVQNLEYVVQQRNSGCIEFTYTVTNSITLAPLDGVEVWVATDVAMTHIVWHGFTNALGEARDSDDALPCLDAGTYYFKKQLAGFFDDDTPIDTEVVS